MRRKYDTFRRAAPSFAFSLDTNSRGGKGESFITVQSLLLPNCMKNLEAMRVSSVSGLALGHLQ